MTTRLPCVERGGLETDDQVKSKTVEIRCNLIAKHQ